MIKEYAKQILKKGEVDMGRTVAVIFGGQSSEHEVSCMSVMTVLKALEDSIYDLVLLGITKDGRWLMVKDKKWIEDGTWQEKGTPAWLLPDASLKSILYMEGEEAKMRPIDAAFPVLHGKYGEDGTIQGLFELARIPYVGCGVLASAVSMDKAYTKLIVDRLGIRQADYVLINHLDMEYPKLCVDKVEERLSYPVFVKPSQAGSSCGVSKAENARELKKALEAAICYDKRILVEETIIGREIECAVLGGYHPAASNAGEILAADQFYTYDAKYNNQESKTDVRPQLPPGVLEGIRKAAVDIFRAVDGYGLSRVDFFVEKDTNEIVFNEINTLPGFTDISMYPMLWSEMGVDLKKLVVQLINEAFAR